MVLPFFARYYFTCAMGCCCRCACCCLSDNEASEKLHAPPPPPTPTHYSIDRNNSKSEERSGMGTVAVKSTEMAEIALKVLHRIEVWAANLGYDLDDQMESTNSPPITRRKAIVSSNSPTRRVNNARRPHLLVCGDSCLAFNCPRRNKALVRVVFQYPPPNLAHLLLCLVFSCAHSLLFFLPIIVSVACPTGPHPPLRLANPPLRLARRPQPGSHRRRAFV